MMTGEREINIIAVNYAPRGISSNVFFRCEIKLIVDD
jgi:hypothetical protein